MKLKQEITDYISLASKEQVEILDELRSIIHHIVPGTSEDIKWKMPVFSKEKAFAYFRHSKKHVTMGFYNPSRIEDKEGLLEGDGSKLKHIKIRSKEDINSVLLSEWLIAISK